MTLSLRPTLLFGALIWIGIALYGAYFLFNLSTAPVQSKPINFGIDLAGGSYFTLHVKVNEVVKNELLGSMQSLIDKLKREQKELPAAPMVNDTAALGTLLFKSEAAATEARKLYGPEDEIVTIGQDGKNLTFTVGAQQLKRLTYNAIESNISVLRTRLDAYGAGEITIVPQGEDNIVIELPSVTDPEQAKARIANAAVLEMKPVYDYSKTKEELLEKHNGTTPEGTMIIGGKKHATETGYYLVPNYAKITGKLLKDARHEIQRDDFSQGTPDEVMLEFNAEGARKFYELTKDHIGGHIAIIIDNVVVSAPGVNQAIEGGKARIYGSFTPEEAKELVMLLKSGAFSAPVDIIEERTIGPSLGQESIRKGLTSCIIGLSLLFAFSVIVYKVAGIFAFIVLLYNLLLILFGLALIPDATLTLPGIAGMVLTVGMAIDSSILIYERIKEELNGGVPLAKAVDAGFSGALSVILDANITTFIVGAVLYYLGSPAIQGFALTMMIGIISTLITGLILLKLIFNIALSMGVQKIRI
jgi:preprotein translocase subunit SecD